MKQEQLYEKRDFTDTRELIEWAAEEYPDADFMKNNGITDVRAYLRRYIDDYNRSAVSYKKIGVLKVRSEDFPKNTLRKIMRFKLDMSID